MTEVTKTLTTYEGWTCNKCICETLVCARIGGNDTKSSGTFHRGGGNNNNRNRGGNRNGGGGAGRSGNKR